MIGKGHPYLDSGWSILEEGELKASPDSPIPEFFVEHFLVTDRRGQTQHQAPSFEAAENWLKEYLEKEQK